MDLVRGELHPAKVCDQPGERELDLRAHECGANAEVGTDAKLEVAARRAPDVEVARFRELSRISAGSDEAGPTIRSIVPPKAAVGQSIRILGVNLAIVRERTVTVTIGAVETPTPQVAALAWLKDTRRQTSVRRSKGSFSPPPT